jgi:hypothetical protein
MVAYNKPLCFFPFSSVFLALKKQSFVFGLTSILMQFLHKIQQIKMKELWDNKEDEAWENV